MRKSKLMLTVEERTGTPVESLIPEMVSEMGIELTARKLGVSKATVGYWLLKLGFEIGRVVQPIQRKSK